ncbi:MAG: MFS transporter [Candidatus Bathyarchaeota archaeon]|nr:MFS transporter [Candidatus Termiticorpusculum sp.]
MTGRTYFIVFCILGALAILSSTMSKTPVLNPFAVSLGTPTDLIGIIAAASTIPGIIVSLPAASLSDIFGRKKVLLFATFIFASAPFLYLGITNWWQLALVRFYHGFATAMFVPVAEATIAERFPAKRGERMAAFNSATYIGRGIAPFLGGSILFITNYGFHTLYIAVAIAGVTSFVIALLLFSENKTNTTINITTQPVNAKIATGQMLQGWLKVARNRGALIVSFVQACQYYAYGVVEFYLVQYMIEIANLNALSVSIVIGMQVISLIVFRPMLGRLSDKYGRRLPIILGCTISGILLFMIPFTTHFALLLAISIGYGLGFVMVISSTSPLMCELTPSNLIGTSMGFLSTIMDIGQTLGPIISGIILATTLAYTGLFTSLTILLITSAIIFTISNINKHHKTNNH